MMKIKRVLFLAIILIECYSISAQDLISGGSNSWIFHTPDNGPTTLSIAPFTNGAWDFQNDITIHNDGSLIVSGKVGIGVNSPSYKLDVLGETRLHGTSSTTLSLKRTGTGNPGIRFDNDNGIGIANIYGGYQGNGGIKFRPHSGGAMDMNFDRDGKLGIKCYPDYTLTVNGNFKVFKDDNYFSYNGSADLRLKYAPRGSGGRAIVHESGNQLWLNYAGDFTGGTRIGKNVYFSNNGNSYINSGNVGIGKTPDANIKLDVCGTVRAKEVKVEEFTCLNGSFDGTLAANNITVKTNGNTADFVFEEDYHLKELSEVENYIKTNKHLPDIPSAKQMEEQGVNLAEMNKLLLQKVEELTLYSIELEKGKEKLENEMSSIKEELQAIKEMILSKK